MEYLIGYMAVNVAGTIASVAVGKHGKDFVQSLKQDSPIKMVGGVVAYLAIGTVAWLPSLGIRLFKHWRKREIDGTQPARA